MRTLALNGNWIEDQEYLGHSPALQFGAGLFETIRVQTRQPLLWEAHMKRLRTSAAELGLDTGLDTVRLENWMLKLVQEAPAADCAMKILWLPDGSRGKALFFFRPLPYTSSQRIKGLTAGIGIIRRNPCSRITAHKTLNYLDNLLERQTAKAQGWDEAILLNTRDEVAEGTATNLFIMLDGTLTTPSVDAGILPGVQRQAVMDACREAGIPCVEARLSLELLKRAEGIYLTNALMGFMPVSNFIGNCYDKKEALVNRINRITGIIDND